MGTILYENWKGKTGGAEREIRNSENNLQPRKKLLENLSAHNKERPKGKKDPRSNLTDRGGGHALSSEYMREESKEGGEGYVRRVDATLFTGVLSKILRFAWPE